MATQLATIPQSAEAEKFALMQRQAQLFASSPLIPQHLRSGTPQQAMANCYIAMTIADRMGEDRMTVMQNIHIVHGTAGFRAQYMIARANASGVFRDGVDWEVEGAGKDLAVTAFATLASTGRRVSIKVDMKMAEAEGWTKNSKYRTMPEIMLRYRSATFLIRMYAPQVMLGHRTVDELEDMGAATMSPAEPLTARMLIEQAQPMADEAPTVPFDAETGEIIEEGRTEADHGDLADGVLARLMDGLEAVDTVPNLNSWWSGQRPMIEALNEDERAELDAAREARIAELKAR